MIIQKTKEYIPYAFNEKGFKSLKYKKIDLKQYKTQYVKRDEYTRKDFFLDYGINRIIDGKYNFQHYIGYGIVFTHKKLGIIMCKSRKEKKDVFLVDKWINPGTLSLFKKMINQNGYNSRKDVIVVEDLSEMFLVDLLRPTMEDYNAQKQFDLSNEFITEVKQKYELENAE